MTTLRMDIDETPFPHALAQLLTVYRKKVPIEQLIDDLEIAKDALHEESAVQVRQVP